jgi:hypothetical protein
MEDKERRDGSLAADLENENTILREKNFEVDLRKRLR